MTVRELIAELEKRDPDLQVVAGVVDEATVMLAVVTGLTLEEINVKLTRGLTVSATFEGLAGLPVRRLG